MRVAAISGSVLGLPVYRGFAPLFKLAELSRADEFDQDRNPLGTQREIRVDHALKAYEYTVSSSGPTFFPEIVLNARDPKLVTFTPFEKNSALGLLEIDESRLSFDKELMISRVDGNHRLHFAAGDKKRKLEPITKNTGFCLVVGLSQEQEAHLFLDINSNQRGMNTSHLDNLRFRLTPLQQTIESNFSLFVAETLCSDPKSPFLGIIHKGSRRKRGKDRSQGMKRLASLRSLSAATQRLLRKSFQLGSLDKQKLQYPIIRQFWNCVRDVFHKDWNQQDSLLLKGVGVTAISLVGAEIIDRCVLANDLSAKRMRESLETIARVADWSSEGRWEGISGVQGAEKIADELHAALVRCDTRELLQTLENRR